MKGRVFIWGVPAVGVVLIALASWGRRPALFGSLFFGLTLLLAGTWKTLTHLAESIGPGLWICAGAALVALVAGIPWQRLIQGARKR